MHASLSQRWSMVMDCNRDEARSLKAIAEDMLDKKAYFVAEMFAKKAQSLHPELEGISGLLATLRVYVCAERKICGETDWYGVLNVNPSDDDDTIKKHYKKLSLVLHPDKNKSVGAEGAFVLMSEAWQFLSDKERRLEYDVRMGYKGFPQNVAPPPVSTQHPIPTDTSGGPSEIPKPSQEDVQIHTVSTPSPRPSSNSGRKRRWPGVPKPTFASSHQSDDTFWTICHGCSLRFLYLRIYHNLIIGCLNCYEPFLAFEAAPPTNCASIFSTIIK